MYQSQNVLKQPVVVLNKSAFSQLGLSGLAGRPQPMLHQGFAGASEHQHCVDEVKKQAQLARDSTPIDEQAALCSSSGLEDDGSSGRNERKNKKLTHSKSVDGDELEDREERDTQGQTRIIKGSWTKQEDQLLLDLVKQNGAKNWSNIAKSLKGRMGKQCRERWHNHLNPDIRKQKWTQEQDRKIIEYHQKFGNRWAMISRFLPGRTDNAIKNHWNSTISRRLAQQKLIKEFSNQGDPCQFTPTKRACENELNTAYSYRKADISLAYETKYSLGGPLGVELFPRRKLDAVAEQPLIKYDDSKLSFIMPIFNSAGVDSQTLLSKISSMLEVSNLL